MKKIALVIFLLFSLVSQSQLVKSNGFGATVGLTVNLGTHINRLGVNVNSFYYYKFFQLNGGAQFNMNLTNWEGFEFGTEINPYAGVQFYFSKENVNNQFVIHEASLNSGKKFGLGYTYKFYWSSLGTSQSTGIFGVHLRDISFIIENDILGFNGKDRYRTSAVAIMFRHKDFELGIQNILWTGETKGVSTKIDPKYKARLGVKDISSLKYGKTSHGVVAVRFNYRLPYGQVFNASMGWNSESLRHLFQNKLVHDLLKNPHYPILDKEGNPQYKTNKPRKKGEFYFQFGVNNVGFY